MTRTIPTTKESLQVPVPVIPVTAGNLTAEEIERRLARFSMVEQENLRATLLKYRVGKASLWEEKKLREAGLLAPLPGAEAAPVVNTDVCDTMEELAKRMMLHYQNPDGSSKLKISITKKVVSDWSHGKRISGIPNPPKPLEGVRRRWSLRAWLDWFDEFLWHGFRLDKDQSNGRDGAGAVGVKMSLNELEEITRRERLEHERWEILKERGGYISVALAEQHAAGVSRQYHDLWKTRNEQTMIEAFETKAQALGLAPEIVAVLKDFLVKEHQKFTDAVEIACERFAAEFEARLRQDDTNGTN